jgi:hypothetical protein
MEPCVLGFNYSNSLLRPYVQGNFTPKVSSDVCDRMHELTDKVYSDPGGATLKIYNP